ncbi:MAG: hypothetical protein IPJ20_25510 [Flammeovirgaceae bacterium]|nr:hypothetical protein [Flammeovirgaceae bacterium]
MDALNALDLEQLLKEGYTDYVVLKGDDPFTMKKSIHVHKEMPVTNEIIRMGGNPSFCCSNKMVKLCMQ